MLAAVIVPPEMTETCQNQFIQLFLNRNDHWQFMAATHFKDLFFSAVTPDDKGFRAAWLFWHLQFSHPLLFRTLKQARIQKKKTAEVKIAESLSRIISREKSDFFNTPYSRYRRKLEETKLRLWCSYLGSFRCNSPFQKQKLTDFIEYHNYLKEITE